MRISEVIMVGAGRGDGDEKGKKPEDFWGSCRKHPRTAWGCIFKLFSSGDMWYAGGSRMNVLLPYAALRAVDTPDAMLFSTPR